MKRILAVLVLIGASHFASADAKYGMAGCGLGSMIFGDKAQIFAATTNDIGMAGFAITSGTSNCQEDPHAAAVQAQQKFFQANLKVLSKEMAQGDGQYVRAFANTMGCKEAVYGTFGSQMQKSYSDIFSAPGANAMLNRVRSVIHENKDLSNNCLDTVI